jgi:hypothetical protein
VFSVEEWNEGQQVAREKYENALLFQKKVIAKADLASKSSDAKVLPHFRATMKHVNVPIERGHTTSQYVQEQEASSEQEYFHYRLRLSKRIQQLEMSTVADLHETSLIVSTISTRCSASEMQIV